MGMVDMEKTTTTTQMAAMATVSYAATAAEAAKLLATGSKTVSDIAISLGISQMTAETAMKGLVAEGKATWSQKRHGCTKTYKLRVIA